MIANVGVQSVSLFPKQLIMVITADKKTLASVDAFIAKNSLAFEVSPVEAYNGNNTTHLLLDGNASIDTLRSIILHQNDMAENCKYTAEELRKLQSDYDHLMSTNNGLRAMYRKEAARVKRLSSQIRAISILLETISDSTESADA